MKNKFLVLIFIFGFQNMYNYLHKLRLFNCVLVVYLFFYIHETTYKLHATYMHFILCRLETKRNCTICKFYA